MQALPQPEIAYLARAVPRHRQGPRRRSLRARRGRCRGLLPRAGPRPLRRAPGRLAGAQSPAAVGHRAEEGHRRSGGDPRVRARGRRPDAPRLPLRAHRRRRARHQSEAVELLEGIAVRGVLRAHQARPAARAREPDRPGGADRAKRRRRRARCCAQRGVEPHAIDARVAARAPRPTSCATRPRRSPGTRACWSRAAPTTRQPLVAVRTQTERGGTPSSPTRRTRRTASPRTTAVLDQLGLNDRRCAHHADRRTASASRPTWCWRTTAQPSPTRRASARSSSAAAQPAAARGLRTPGRDAARAAPGAHVLDARRRSTFSADRAQRPHHPRADRRRPAGTAVARSAKVFASEGVACTTREDRDRRRARRGRLLHHRRSRRPAVRQTPARAPAADVWSKPSTAKA